MKENSTNNEKYTQKENFQPNRHMAYNFINSACAMNKLWWSAAIRQIRKRKENWMKDRSVRIYDNRGHWQVYLLT